ncbi:hypothetical protein BB561_003516 [Smittium simulii]|uniref:Glucose-6-phosphate isomerase n=1 Tax=Smittium simulii TaxID=133385 RepID=A0A2T9YKV6_9FUNG|nr:hypothetical protein BB561_003516 [Smittium simulii]
MDDYTELPSYKKLASHYKNTAKNIDLCKEFSKDSERQANFCRKGTFVTTSGKVAKIIFDFSKNLIYKETFSLLLEFAQEARLLEHIEFFFSGTFDKNTKHTESNEKKKNQDDFKYENKLNISTICEKMKNISEDIRNQERKSIFGSDFSSIVVIGIKSSNLKHDIVSKAFSNIGSNIMMYFASDTEGSRIEDILQKIDFKSTLFIISCKNFTDKKTNLSAEAAKKYILSKIDEYNYDLVPDDFISFDSYMKSNFMAISKNKDLVIDFGISESNRFEFCDWINAGVCSFWAEMILPMSIYMGFPKYNMFLEGCYSMDIHFRYTPIEDNLPVIMALLDFWYENFFGAKTFPILPYDQCLTTFATYFQRSDKVSNKNNSISSGFDLEYQLGPSIWSGDDGKLRYMLYQLIYQENKVIPCDLIALVKYPKLALNSFYNKLSLSNFIALSEALMKGSASDINPFSLGILVALYEHRKSIRDLLGNINTLSCKDIKLVNYFAKNILTELNDKIKVYSHDKSTNELINFYKNNL